MKIKKKNIMYVSRKSFTTVKHTMKNRNEYNCGPCDKTNLILLRWLQNNLASLRNQNRNTVGLNKQSTSRFWLNEYQRTVKNQQLRMNSERWWLNAHTHSYVSIRCYNPVNHTKSIRRLYYFPIRHVYQHF